MHKAFYETNFVDFPYTFIVFVWPNKGLFASLDESIRLIRIKKCLSRRVGKFRKFRVIKICGIAAIID